MFIVYVITIFPEAFPGNLDVSLIGKARRENKWCLNLIDLKKHAIKKKKLDSRPFGGGPGMIIRADVLQSALNEIESNLSSETFKRMEKIILSPRGSPLNQITVCKLSKLAGLILICGRYEGVDERFISHNNLSQISIGDFILMGGEVASMALVEGVIRILPSVIGNPKSVREESFNNGMLEHPQFTKPRVWNNKEVPKVLLSGNHKKIAEWKKNNSKPVKKNNS